jgi:hypothetical protein
MKSRYFEKHRRFACDALGLDAGDVNPVSKLSFVSGLERESGLG